jgi:hypothetical protein
VDEIVPAGGTAGEAPTPAPPWVVFNRGDGTSDVLPAGRLGTILARLPSMLAKRIAEVANASLAIGTGGTATTGEGE